MQQDEIHQDTKEQSVARKYKLTLLACTMSVWVFVIGINLIPLLFVPLMNLYSLPFSALGLLIGISFVAQLIIMLLFSKLPDKIGLRPILLTTSLLAAAGFLLLFSVPYLFSSNILAGLILSVIVYGTAAGFMGTMLNPIINALPLKNKARSLTLFHAVSAVFIIVAIVGTTVSIYLLPEDSWNFVPLLWVAVPFVCFAVWLKAPIIKPQNDNSKEGRARLRKKGKALALFLCAFTVAMASEAIVAKGASAYIEVGLDVPKLVGDLLGPAMFALSLGIGRLLYGLWGKKINIRVFMTVGSLVCFLLYLVAALTPHAALGVVALVLCGFAVSLLVPGMIAATGTKFADAGVFIFVMLSAAGKIGAAGGPSLFGLLGGLFDASFIVPIADRIGMSTQQTALRMALLVCAVFPLLSFILQIVLNRGDKKIMTNDELQTTN